MKKYLTVLVVLFSVMVFGMQAHALSITPADTAWIVATGEGQDGNQNSQAVIDGIISGMIVPAVELYKAEADPYAQYGLTSYTTVFNNDFSGATITYTGGAYIGDTIFMLVKDGNHTPWWYLFDLTAAEWNGTETLELSGFWPNGGSISHVSLYGTQSAQVPEPAALILLGMGLLGIAGIRRKMNK